MCACCQRRHAQHGDDDDNNDTSPEAAKGQGTMGGALEDHVVGWSEYPG